MPPIRYRKQTRPRTEDTPGARSLSSGGHRDFRKVPRVASSLGEDRGEEVWVHAPGSERDKAKDDEVVNTVGHCGWCGGLAPRPGNAAVTLIGPPPRTDQPTDIQGDGWGRSRERLVSDDRA